MTIIQKKVNKDQRKVISKQALIQQLLVDNNQRWSSVLKKTWYIL